MSEETTTATDVVPVADPTLEFNSPLESKAYDLMLKGRNLNSCDTFSQDAFDLFSKAIKLNPYLIEAWIELTTCYQKKCDIDGAISCLENALKYCDSDKPNKIILRKLSICIRQKSCHTQEAKVAALLRSLELSKQALKSDLCDEENYYNLAKAYMCLFFVTECVDQQLINLSKAAFVKALTLSDENFTKRKDMTFKLTSVQSEKACTSNNDLKQDEPKPFIEQSDFLFNYSSVLLYLQDFQKSLELLRLAIKLDPDWAEPRNLEECVVDYLRQINSMTNELSKNNKKIVRRYSKVVDSLKNVDKIEKVIQADQQRLSKSTEVKVESLTLDLLESHTNTSTLNGSASNLVNLLHVKLLNTINYNQAMYLTFVAVDQNYSIIVITIYNLAASRCPSPKDVVTIVDPKIDEIKVENVIGSDKGSVVAYRRINVRKFESLYVNGYRITTDQVSKPQFSVSILP